MTARNRFASKRISYIFKIVKIIVTDQLTSISDTSSAWSTPFCACSPWGRWAAGFSRAVTAGDLVRSATFSTNDQEARGKSVYNRWSAQCTQLRYIDTWTPKPQLLNYASLRTEVLVSQFLESPLRIETIICPRRGSGRTTRSKRWTERDEAGYISVHREREEKTQENKGTKREKQVEKTSNRLNDSAIGTSME